MKTLFPVNGIITVLNTPFTNDNQIDLEALKKHVTLAMEAGVSGFLVPAMASEVYKLSKTERLKMVETVLTLTNNEVVVFAGTGESDLGLSLELLKEYIELGCENVLFQIPFENRDQFKKHFMEMANLQPKVIMLQDWDSMGCGLPDELILELFECVESFRCLKIETVLSGLKYSRMLDLTQGKLHVSGGWAVTQMLEGLKRGIHAFMPTGMHFIYTKIFEDFKANREKEAEKLFNEILPILSFSNQHLDFSILFFKRLLYRQQIYQNDFVRHPTFQFDKLQKEIADKWIDKILFLENKIKSKNYL